MKNNSFILLKEEKERIKKLYEATTASAAGHTTNQWHLLNLLKL